MPSYTSSLLSLISDRVAAVGADSDAIAAVEIASSYYASAFSVATVSPVNVRTAALTPSVMSLIGRTLIKPGQLILHITSQPSGIALQPVGSWDIFGGPDPSSWSYRLNLFGPSMQSVVFAPSASVINLRYSIRPAEPWLGVGPLTHAYQSGKLSAGLEACLAAEVSASSGYVLPLPQEADTQHVGEDEEVGGLSALKRDLENLQGRTALVETTAGGWGKGVQDAPRQEWQPRRIGANPPDSLVALQKQTHTNILAACGVPPSLAELGEGTGQRESLRRFLHVGVQPLARMILPELREKLNEPELSFNFDALMASDLQGRARAFQSLVGGGMEVERAATLSGMMQGEED